MGAASWLHARELKQLLVTVVPFDSTNTILEFAWVRLIWAALTSHLVTAEYKGGTISQSIYG